jgi:hypothetical protein
MIVVIIRTPEGTHWQSDACNAIHILAVPHDPYATIDPDQSIEESHDFGLGWEMREKGPPQRPPRVRTGRTQDMVVI